MVSLIVHKMSKAVQIFFLYADNCPDCRRAKIELEEAIRESNIVCDLKLFNSERRVAINIAIENDINDIPACVVGNKTNVFQTKDITKANILSAILKMSSSS